MAFLNQETLQALQSLAADDGLPIRVSGHCMSPLIEDQATLRIRPRAIYLPGDILTFLGRDGRLTTHRLLGIFPRNGKLHCLTRPDNHAHPDAAFPLSQVLGRVTGGECLQDAIQVPWSARLNALGHFIGHALRRLFLS